jgi:hypothetical protein
MRRFELAARWSVGGVQRALAGQRIGGRDRRGIRPLPDHDGVALSIGCRERLRKVKRQPTGSEPLRGTEPAGRSSDRSEHSAGARPRDDRLRSPHADRGEQVARTGSEELRRRPRRRLDSGPANADQQQPDRTRHHQHPARHPAILHTHHGSVCLRKDRTVSHSPHREQRRPNLNTGTPSNKQNAQDSPEPRMRTAAPSLLGPPKPLTSSLSPLAAPGRMLRASPGGVRAAPTRLQRRRRLSRSGPRPSALGPRPSALGPRLLHAPDGTPPAAITAVVRLGHARTPPQRAQLCEPGRPAHPRAPRPSAPNFR